MPLIKDTTSKENRGIQLKQVQTGAEWFMIIALNHQWEPEYWFLGCFVKSFPEAGDIEIPLGSSSRHRCDIRWQLSDKGVSSNRFIRPSKHYTPGSFTCMKPAWICSRKMHILLQLVPHDQSCGRICSVSIYCPCTVAQAVTLCAKLF